MCCFLGLDYLPPLPLWLSPSLPPGSASKTPHQRGLWAVAKLAPLKSPPSVSSSERRLLLDMACVFACGIVCFPHHTRLRGRRDTVWVAAAKPSIPGISQAPGKHFPDERIISGRLWLCTHDLSSPNSPRPKCCHVLICGGCRDSNKCPLAPQLVSVGGGI